VFSCVRTSSAKQCSGIIGLLASDLAPFAPAQSFCSSRFAIPKTTVTVTAAAQTTTMTVATSTLTQTAGTITST
jgi:hypothetical protein